MIFVTNKNDFAHIDRYNGKDYLFEPGEAVPLDEAAANHMFGFGTADKTDTLVRLGWAFRYNESIKRLENDPEGVQKLRKFVFSKGEYVKSKEPLSDMPEQAALLDETDSPI